MNDSAPPELEGVTIGALLAKTGKSTIWEATHEGLPVVVKVLTDSDPYWAAKFRNEQDIYRRFSEGPAGLPSVAAPRLINLDQSVLVVERCEGLPLADARYPTTTDKAAILQAIQTAETLPSMSLGFDRRMMDYADRIDRYHEKGLIDLATRGHLDRLTEECTAGTWVFQHGDLQPSNIFTSKDRCVFIDWEFAGLYLPCYDLALMGVLLHKTGAGKTITDIVRELPTSDRASYWLNLAMILTRELRILIEAGDEENGAIINGIWHHYCQQLPGKVAELCT